MVYLCRALLASADCSRAKTRTGFNSACSQILTTRQPSRFSRRPTARSRSLFLKILGVQKPRRDFGIRQCHRHPCQKQPSTNTATRCLRKTKSGFPGNEGCLRQPLIPWARRIEANLNSVALLPFDRMAAMTCERFRFEKTSAIASRTHYNKIMSFLKIRRKIRRNPPGAAKPPVPCAPP